MNMNKKSFRILYFVVVSIIVVVITVVGRSNSAVYDIKGNRYSKAEDVLYYTSDGESFKKDNDNFALQSTRSDRVIKGDDAFIDENGYLVVINHSTINYDETKLEKTPYCFYDDNGNWYADVFTSVWDKDGNIKND